MTSGYFNLGEFQVRAGSPTPPSKVDLRYRRSSTKRPERQICILAALGRGVGEVPNGKSMFLAQKVRPPELYMNPSVQMGS